MARIRRMTKKRLGELLVDEGLIAEQQVQEVLAEQKKTGGLFGEILVSKSYVTESDIARTIARQFSIPFISARGYNIPHEVAALFPFDMLEKYQFVPIDRFGDVLTVVIAGVVDRRVLEEMEKVSGCTVQIYAGTTSDVKETLKKLSAEKDREKRKKQVKQKPKEEPEPEEIAPPEGRSEMEKILEQAIQRQAELGTKQPAQQDAEKEEGKSPGPDTVQGGNSE